MTDEQFEEYIERKKHTKLEDCEELPSSEYNKFLLERAKNKIQSESDTKALIHQIVSHGEFKKIPVPMTHQQKAALKSTFTSEQIWGAKVPRDFHGGLFEWIAFCENEKKEKEMQKKGNLNL